MDLLREALTNAWAEAQKSIPEVKQRVMVFGGSPEDHFVYLQLDSQVVFKFTLGSAHDRFSKPWIHEVGNMGVGTILHERSGNYKLLVDWWGQGLKSYLMSVKRVGNASLLPDDLKNYLIETLL